MLRLGVALLGLKITMAEVTSLGWSPLLLVVAAVALTIVASTLAARWMGFDPRFGVLSGGATAICGASAAMAISAALPSHPLKEYATLFTVVGVSILSTVAMLLYPAIARYAGLDDTHAGIFIGATVHDVAQVIGAGYAISPETGDTATIVKLARVAMLLPVIVAIAARVAEPRHGGAGPPADPALVRHGLCASRRRQQRPSRARLGPGGRQPVFALLPGRRDRGAGDEDPDQGHCVRRLAPGHIDGAGDHLHRRDRAYRDQVGWV